MAFEWHVDGHPDRDAGQPGTYSITPGGLTSTNYNFSFVAATLTVTKAPTVTTVAVSPAAPGVSQAVTFTATVAPNPATAIATPPGTVNFFVGGSATPAATVALAGGQASFTTDFGGGSHSVTAVYRGGASSTIPEYEAWYEMYPANSVNVSGSIPAT